MFEFQNNISVQKTGMSELLGRTSMQLDKTIRQCYWLNSYQHPDS